MELESRLHLFQNLVRSCHDLYLWTYDCAMHLISSNCPEQETIHNLFATACQQSAFHSQIAEVDTPLLLTSISNKK